LDAFLAWINNSLVQSAIISPLVSVILGLLLGGFNNTPSHSAPGTVQQTVVIFRQTIIVQSRGTSSSSGDGWAYLAAACIVTVVVIWGYSRYANDILHYWFNGTLSCAVFIFVAGLTSVIRSDNRMEWSRYIFMPLLAVGASFYLIKLSQEGIIAGAREATYRHGVISYYFKVLEHNQQIWILCQILGVLMGMGTTLAAALRSLHYLALMHQRASGVLSSLWFALAWYTRFTAQGRGVWLLIALFGLAYAMLSGHVYEIWMQPRG